jgi:hypothetical protein
VADDGDARQQAITRIKAKRDFQLHLVIFLLVNALLWVIWAVTGTGFPWPIFVTFGWGIGVVANWWSVYGGGSRPITEEQIQREMRDGGAG